MSRRALMKQNGGVKLDIDFTAQLAKKLSMAIQIETTAEKGFSQKAFLQFHDYLKRGFPLVHKYLTCTVILDASLVFHWKGIKSDAPLVLLAHMDVAPAEEPQLWTHPPFEGFVDDKYIWGRGAIDDKHQIIFQLEAVERLLETGFCPQQDIYLCYGHNEETMECPSGAQEIVKYLKQNNVRAGLVLDEGGGVFEGTIFESSGYYSFVSLCEKGYADILLTAVSKGGHSSSPCGKSALNRVAAAACGAEDMPARMKVTETVRQLFRVHSPSAGESEIIRQLRKTGVGRAMLRSTVAFTMAKGSAAPNILPQQATAILNCRLLPGDTVENMLGRIQKIAAPYEVSASLLKGCEPSAISRWDSSAAMFVRGIISEVFPDAAPCPNMMLGGSDARYYSGTSENILRFVPVRLTSKEKSCMHGINERIPLSALETGVEFYQKLMRRYSLHV